MSGASGASGASVMPVISVILPTIRPHLVERCFSSIRPACGRVPHEVVIVADFDPFNLAGFDVADLERCTWLMRERNGVVAAVNEACRWAKGTHWFLFNDESVLDAGALETLHREALREPRHLLGPRHLPEYPFFYYGREFVPFPFAHRDLIADLGGLLDPIYRGFYADPDLSMRAYAQNVPVRTVNEAIIRHCNEHDHAHARCVSMYLEGDRATFQQRWNHLGEFRDP